MRIAAAMIVLALVARAQAPLNLLSDLEKVAKRDVQYLAIEARLRVAELTRLTEPSISRRFADAAARTGGEAGGMASYYAIRTLAGFDLDAAEATAEFNDAKLAYRAFTEQAIYNDDPVRFLRLFAAAHEHEAYGLASGYLALRKWGGDELFTRDLTTLLVNGLPEDPSPADAIYLFDLFRIVGAPSIDPELIRRAVSQLANAVIQPGFNLPELHRTRTVFLIHGRKIVTNSLPEAAYLRALAFGAAIDEKTFLREALNRISWAPLLEGITLDELSIALNPIEMVELPPDKTDLVDREDAPDLRTTSFDDAMGKIENVRTPMIRSALRLELAERGGLTARQYAELYKAQTQESLNLDNRARLDAAAAFYKASVNWTRVPERDLVTVFYTSEIQRLAQLDDSFAAQLRDSGELLDRLDEIVVQLGRVVSKWPECLRRNSSLVLRHYVYETEQATLYGPVDAIFHITGGSDMTLRSLRGRVVVIAFWRTGCPSCQVVRQAINRLNQPLGIRGLWAVALSDEPEDVVLESLDHQPFWASIAIDETGRDARSFAVSRFPAVVVIDRAGRLIARVEAKRAGAFPLADFYRALEGAGLRIR